MEATAPEETLGLEPPANRSEAVRSEAATAPDPSFPEFRARAPWWGPDLQTLRNFLRPPVPFRPVATTQRLHFPMQDGTGDELVGLLEEPNRTLAKRPLVILIHGLSGSEESAYLLTSSAALLTRGYSVLRLNLRGAGPSRSHCRLQYHAGRSEDLRQALAVLPEELARDGVALVGFSLGGNMLLKYLGEQGADPRILCAASISAPIDLAAASERFLDHRNRAYHMKLLHSMKQESLGEGAQLLDGEADLIRKATSILEFDEGLVAPRNGFAHAAAYYDACHGRQFLMGIRTPTLVIHALDDPWIPGSAYLDVAWQDNPSLRPLLPEGGGHVGFHGMGSRTPWHDRSLAIWLEANSGCASR